MTTGPGGGRVFFLRRNSTALERDGDDEVDRLGGDDDTGVDRATPEKDNSSTAVVGVCAANVGEDDSGTSGDGEGGGDDGD